MPFHKALRSKIVDHSNKTMNYELNSHHFKVKLGFTLIELIVVISIIGILTTIGTATYTTAQQKSRDARRKQDLGALKSALILYYRDYKEYPPVCSPLPCTDDEYMSSGTSSDWIDGLFTYMAGNMPKDPIQTSGDCTSANTFCYKVMDDRQSFVLFARLENTKDPELRTNSNALCQADPPSLSSLNYCLKSPTL